MNWFLNSRQRIRRTWRATLPSIVLGLVALVLFADRFAVSTQVQVAVASPIQAFDAIELNTDWVPAEAGSSETASSEATEQQEEGTTDDDVDATDESSKDNSKDKEQKKKKEEDKKEGAAAHGTANEPPKLQDKDKDKDKEEEPVVPRKALTREEQLDEKLERIRNPRNNDEALEYVAVDTKRKLLDEAVVEAARTGKKVDLYSNRRFSPEMERSYGRLERSIRAGILNGSLDEREGLQTLAQARVAGRKFTAGGDFLNGKVPDKWDPGRPAVLTGLGPSSPGFQLAKAQNRIAKLYENMNTLLTSPRATPTLTNGVTRLDVIRQQSLYALDHTAVTQGNMGTCWTCSAEGMGWAWAPDQMSSANNQLIFTQKFVSPFNGRVQSYRLSELMPTRSNLNYDMNRADMGEQSYVNMLDQVLIGNLAGNPAPWNGGFPDAASNALYTVTGLGGVPTQASVGGVPGLIRGINAGTLRIVQYIPFPGHSASNSGMILPTTDGGYLGFGINDNSWGPRNEHAFLATQENAGKFKFPGGGGSQFGGEGGGITGAVSGVMAGLLGAMQGQPVSPADQQAAEEATTQQQDEDYNKLDTNSRVLVRSVCIESVTPSTTSLPHVCRRALTDRSLPELFPSRRDAPSQTKSDPWSRF